MMMISQLASCHFKKDVLLNLSSQALHKIDVEVSLLLNFGASGGGGSPKASKPIHWPGIKSYFHQSFSLNLLL